MKRLKSQKGITLVALVITIIVLLILAVVAIGAVRDSGIIGHAQNSADKYNSGKLEEESMLGDYEDEIGKYDNTGVKDASAEKGIEYYVLEGTIQQVNRKDKIAIVYFDNGKDGFKKVVENYFTEGEPTNEIIKINVENPRTKEIEEKELPVGAIPIKSNGVVGAYFSGNKLYGAGASGYYTAFELVTDKSEIAKIEAAIANIK